MLELKARERTLLSEKEVDLKALNKVIDEQTDLLNKMKKLEAEQKVAVKGILTDEQIMNLERQRERRQQFRYKGNDRWESPRRGGPYHRNMG
jgi:t-SNARE complex subunit (syntaxin)